MADKKSNKRRQFLKNVSLAALTTALITKTAKSESSVVSNEDIQEDCNPTTLDWYGEGPFYTANPPILEDNILAESAEEGQRMIISGRVHNLDCSEFIPNTIIDVWHANNAGAYDNVGYNLRGVVTSNAQGFYMFETIKPGKYLNGSTFRPSHIHFRITPPEFPLLITQLYFEGDSDIPGDAAASITTGTYDASNRIISLTESANGVLEGTWDIVVDGEGVNGVNELHLSNGMIYDVSPNPFSKEVLIRYGVFKSAKVSIHVYDMNGLLVANLKEEKLSPEKYEAIWLPQNDLPDGHYFITLKINDLQVHYKKIIKQS